MPSARVVAVAPDSPAALAGIRSGDELTALNGEALRDVIRYQLQADEPDVDVVLRRGADEMQLQIAKAPGAPLGIELQSAVFDRVRTCDNHCPFCFIYQLPKGMRRSLYVKDDDYRLSFLYGNFTTLTRFTEADFERVTGEGLSPLYVSIHATDPEVRARLLRNRRGATSLRWLSLLLDAGVDVHGQIVCCPGINDGRVLDDTLFGVLDRFPRLATLGVVPLGLSAHSNEPEMRAHTAAEAHAVVDVVEAWQARYLDVLGRRLVYASDEYYLLCDRPFPSFDDYDGFAQHENGVGMAVTMRAEVDAALRGVTHDRSESHRGGFFAWVEGAPADGYRSPRQRGGATVPRPRAAGGAPITILTGALGARILEPMRERLSAYAGVALEIAPVANEFFGGNIGVTGLITGSDVTRALASVPMHHRVLLPDVALSRGRFLDGVSVAQLPRTVEIVATNGAALVAALDPSAK